MILDASALLALLLKESGAGKVLEAIKAGAEMNVVNFAKVASRYGRQGADEATIKALRTRLPFRLIPLDDEIAIEAGLMAKQGASFGLSLGDRCCLATAKRVGLPALTSDRVWVEAGRLLGVSTVLIR